jgi:hypothetical protein
MRSPILGTTIATHTLIAASDSRMMGMEYWARS